MAIKKAGANPNAVPCTKCTKVAIPAFSYSVPEEDWKSDGTFPARLMAHFPIPVPPPEPAPVCWACFDGLLALVKRARRVLVELLRRKPLLDPLASAGLVDKLTAAPETLATWEKKLGLVAA